MAEVSPSYEALRHDVAYCEAGTGLCGQHQGLDGNSRIPRHHEANRGSGGGRRAVKLGRRVKVMSTIKMLATALAIAYAANQLFPPFVPETASKDCDTITECPAAESD